MPLRQILRRTWCVVHLISCSRINANDRSFNFVLFLVEVIGSSSVVCVDVTLTCADTATLNTLDALCCRATTLLLPLPSVPHPCSLKHMKSRHRNARNKRSSMAFKVHFYSFCAKTLFMRENIYFSYLLCAKLLDSKEATET
ncbi:hypothetical protein BKA70DRAFT_679875 [Coprinopsis sp. MPI-PUGE-AT-0042]|nr:hypothetical protein BKA70DRAFT_679875 [Coprinopsis sp. MPI-PUGE-AT-0042]